MALRTLPFARAGLVMWMTAVLAAAPDHVDIPEGALTLHTTLYRPDGAGRIRRRGAAVETECRQAAEDTVRKDSAARFSTHTTSVVSEPSARNSKVR